MKDFLVTQIFDGTLVIAMLVALIAGLVSFLSPCVLPLLPGYLSYAAGVTQSKARIFLGSILFVSGFALLFTFYGALFGSLGASIEKQSSTLFRILGLFTILLGLIFIYSNRFTFSWRPSMQKFGGLASAPILGFLFGLGWTPCIGPTLAAVQTIAFQEASAVRGALLSLTYSFGLGSPFIFFGLFLERSKKLLRFFSKRGNYVTNVGGGLLILIGFLQVFGFWNDVMSLLRSSIANFIPVI